jgi:hypothetical protein
MTNSKSGVAGPPSFTKHRNTVVRPNLLQGVNQYSCEPSESAFADSENIINQMLQTKTKSIQKASPSMA